MLVCMKSILKNITSFHKRQPVYSKLSAAHFQTYSPVYGKKKEEKTKKGDTSKPETDRQNVMSIKVLNVAEKNDAAKNIAQLLSNGGARRVSIYVKGWRVRLPSQARVGLETQILKACNLRQIRD